MDELWFICHLSQMSGNPVKIRDGCATVTGYEFPMPLMQIGKAGMRLSPESGYRFDCARRLRRSEHFSVKEKDEASRLNAFQVELLNAFIPRFAGV